MLSKCHSATGHSPSVLALPVPPEEEQQRDHSDDGNDGNTGDGPCTHVSTPLLSFSLVSHSRLVVRVRVRVRARVRVRVRVRVRARARARARVRHYREQ